MRRFERFHFSEMSFSSSTVLKPATGTREQGAADGKRSISDHTEATSNQSQAPADLKEKVFVTYGARKNLLWVKSCLTPAAIVAVEQ
jgi:hypothetical protein